MIGGWLASLVSFFFWWVPLSLLILGVLGLVEKNMPKESPASTHTQSQSTEKDEELSTSFLESARDDGVSTAQGSNPPSPSSGVNISAEDRAYKTLTALAAGFSSRYAERLEVAVQKQLKDGVYAENMQNEVEPPFDGEELDVYEEVLALIVKSQGALTNLRLFEDIIAEEEAAGTLESYKAAVLRKLVHVPFKFPGGYADRSYLETDTVISRSEEGVPASTHPIDVVASNSEDTGMSEKKQDGVNQDTKLSAEVKQDEEMILEEKLEKDWFVCYLSFETTRCF
jgi:hypothetical protein